MTDQTNTTEQVDPYPEHTKLIRIGEISHAQGELLDWLAEQGVHLMRWFEHDELEPGGCYRCGSHDEAGRQWCTKNKLCRLCRGEHNRTKGVQDWVPYGKTTRAILAEYHGIDLDKLEAEKRAMLAGLRRARG